VAVRTPEDWKQKHTVAQYSHEEHQIPDADPPVCSAERRAACMRLTTKVYEVETP